MSNKYMMWGLVALGAYVAYKYFFTNEPIMSFRSVQPVEVKMPSNVSSMSVVDKARYKGL